MADTSGALLLRSGIVKPEQVAEAQRLRQRDGGSFGEALVRIGAIDEEKLVEFYHKRLMIPRLDERKLSTVPPKVLGLVAADMASEFRVIPVETDNDGAVVLAMADPSDNHAVDEVTFFADRFVVRAVASETAVRSAIERLYGIRFSSPPSSAQPSTPQPTPPPAKARKAPEAPRPTREQLDEQIVLLTKVKRSEETPLPMPMPPPPDYKPQYAAEDPEPILLVKPKPREKRHTLPGLTAPVPDPPLEALRGSVRRDEIERAMLDYLAQLTKRAILFVVKKELLVGQDARGADPKMIKELAIDIAAASIFRDVISSRLPYRGPMPETPANRAFAGALGGVGAEVLLMPIAIRDRIIAVLFADSPTQPLPDAALHATFREAGLAYERQILAAKAKR